MMNTMQAIRNTFAKPAKRANDVHLSKENQPEGDEKLNSLREFRRNRVMTKPIPSESTSVFD